MTSTVPFVTHVDAARVARVAAQTPGALSGIKSVAAYFDKRLEADPIGAVTSAEIDRVFKYAMARAEARGDRQETWELDALAQQIAAQAPVVSQRNLFAEFEKLAHTIKSEDQYWVTLKRLGHADDSIESRRAQLYLRAFVLQAQGLPIGEEPEASGLGEAPLDADLDSDVGEELPEAGMPEHQEMTETHAEGRSPHTGQPIVVELGALEDYDVTPKVTQVMGEPEMEGPPDALAVGESFGDGMDVIITIEDPTAPGKYLDLKIAPHVTEDDLGQLSDESFSTALDGGAEAEGYSEYDVYAAPTEGVEEPDLEGEGTDEDPLRLAEFRSRSVIAAVTRVASTLLRGYTGRVQKIAEGALITVDSPATDGRTYSVLIGQRAVVSRSAAYGWMALPPAQPGPRSMVDKQMVSRGTNTQQMGEPVKAAEDGSETDSPTGRDHTDENAHNKKVEVMINADTEECADVGSMCEADYERRASVLADSGLLISTETIERELLRGAEVRVASARIVITSDDVVQIRRGSVTMPGMPLRDIESALINFRRAASASAKAAQLEAQLERTHGVRVLEVKVPGKSLADRHVNAKKIATALKRIARPLRILAASDKSSMKVELAGVSPAREKHIEGLIKSKYRTAMAWAAELGPAAVGAVEKVAPGIMPHVERLDPAGQVNAAPKGTEAELKETIADHLDPLVPSKGAPKVGGAKAAQFARSAISESPSRGDISMVQTEDGVIVQTDGEPPMGPFPSMQVAEDNVRLLLQGHPDAAVFYGTDSDTELQPHMLTAQEKDAKELLSDAIVRKILFRAENAKDIRLASLAKEWLSDARSTNRKSLATQKTPERLTFNEEAELERAARAFGLIRSAQLAGGAPGAGAAPGGAAVDEGGESAGLDFSEPLTPEGRKVIESALQTYRNQNLGPVEAQVQFLKDFREFFDMAGEEGSERRMMAEAALMGIVADIWQKPVIRPDQMFARPEGMPALFEADAAEEAAALDMGGTDVDFGGSTRNADLLKKKPILASRLVL